MVQIFNVLFPLLAVSAVSAVPMQKRIAQTIADSTTQFVAACVCIFSLFPQHRKTNFLISYTLQEKAGGAGKCNTVSQTAFTTLLAAGGNCDQQNAADSMVDLAKTLNNNADMIRLAQIFVQQPRNSVLILLLFTPISPPFPRNLFLDA
jgi:hypothetical protein